MLLYWLIWEWGCRRPFLDIRLFGRRNFTIGVIGLFAGFCVFKVCCRC